jgi:hypothetical protein
MLRGECRDYLTTFPRQEIVPAPHNTARGIFESFTPLLGVSYSFQVFVDLLRIGNQDWQSAWANR